MVRIQLRAKPRIMGNEQTTWKWRTALRLVRSFPAPSVYEQLRIDKHRYAPSISLGIFG